jgi:hypothetical protein
MTAEGFDIGLNIVKGHESIMQHSSALHAGTLNRTTFTHIFRGWPVNGSNIQRVRLTGEHE